MEVFGDRARRRAKGRVDHTLRIKVNATSQPVAAALLEAKAENLAQFEDFFRLLPERADSERSWSVKRSEIEARGFDLKAVNPNARSQEDPRTPEELLDLIEAKGREVAEAITVLRKLTAGPTSSSWAISRRSLPAAGGWPA